MHRDDLARLVHRLAGLAGGRTYSIVLTLPEDEGESGGNGTAGSGAGAGNGQRAQAATWWIAAFECKDEPREMGYQDERRARKTNA